ncbi:exodeoxyribonuclease VII large subunit [Macrococcus hajekii]|uniref:Exodeoxyribonuclease 7 large subunit n=1 Tax=Macrococcus hajekii TaxID=198482 RepID=A0A4R6BM92_9STAP|nr:exodeoxyribonuclease VII large subunit [Macrococcus hajekii]TDM02930.1 exodeoxyribonuclease VII large subunit [Macrococcus hajekii]GGB05023.1 exodeoxyribonuclease 7 large subunit [Macrococcus hajekii]
MTQYLSIGALTKYIKAKFDRDPYLEKVYIKGELSNVKHHSSGHIYFGLKDGNAMMNAMMFKRDALKLNFTPKEGDGVLISGRVSVYEIRGSYQLYADTMSLDGIGQLYEKYEALKKELQQKGFFSDDNKKPLPRYPAAIAVLTASTGAAVRDIETTLKRRYPLAEVHYISTLVQGNGAAADIVKNIRHADTLEVDVIIVGRGGGSIEDLWAFNEKEVVEAIYHAKTPIISAVGHETDTTLSDYAADMRAPTPTGAAVMATPDQFDLLQQLKSTDLYLNQQLTQKVKYQNERLTRFMNHPVFRNPQVLIAQQQQRKDEIEQKLSYLLQHNFNIHTQRYIRLQSKLSSDRLKHSIHLHQSQVREMHNRVEQRLLNNLAAKKHNLTMQSRLLTSLNPTNVLGRGYSIVRDDNGIVSSIKRLKENQPLHIQLADGEVEATINRVKEHSYD